eukprot:CAMPEP_0196756488 /NCGR_PEP_ID=MMETSP1091-20130531/101160_1 /TAXON_ID=302021 /ORGANISM="Rhodomonas sp., Strain CCMP768" /LENGTH=103 /DNA_ID=CAMNT_0042105113 /DNA_START=44 /DNA_END=352 /DNA_ORIENTATION=+
MAGASHHRLGQHVPALRGVFASMDPCEGVQAHRRVGAHARVCRDAVAGEAAGSGGDDVEGGVAPVVGHAAADGGRRVEDALAVRQRHPHSRVDAGPVGEGEDV